MPRERKATVARRGRSLRERGESSADASQPSTSNTVQNATFDSNNSSSGVSSDARSLNRIERLDTRSTAATSESDEVSTLSKRVSPGFKLASAIIPEYHGENMPVRIFIEHCRAAAETVESREIKYLILLIRTKVMKCARKYVWGKLFQTLEAILVQLKRSATSNDSSQLFQDLTHVRRKPEEKLADYGSRVFAILTEIEECLQREYPGEVGKSMITEIKQTAVKPFVRGLDKSTLTFLAGKELKDLDHAIDLAAIADVEGKFWEAIHGSSNNSRSFRSYTCNQPKLLSGGQVARLKSDPVTSGPSRGNSRGDKQCYYCKGYGHIKRSCPKLRNDKPNSNGDGKMHCNYCSRDNHREHACFLKRKHDEERNFVVSKTARKEQESIGLNENENRRAGAATVQAYPKRLESDTSSTFAKALAPDSQ